MNYRKIPDITGNLPSRLTGNSQYHLSRKSLNKTRYILVPESGSTGYFTRTTSSRHLLRTEYRRVGTRYSQTLPQYRTGSCTPHYVGETGDLPGTIHAKHPFDHPAALAIAKYHQTSNLNKQTYRSKDYFAGSIGLLIHLATLLTRPISQYSAYRSAP